MEGTISCELCGKAVSRLGLYGHKGSRFCKARQRANRLKSQGYVDMGRLGHKFGLAEALNFSRVDWETEKTEAYSGSVGVAGGYYWHIWVKAKDEQEAKEIVERAIQKYDEERERKRKERNAEIKAIVRNLKQLKLKYKQKLKIARAIRTREIAKYEVIPQIHIGFGLVFSGVLVELRDCCEYFLGYIVDDNQCRYVERYAYEDEMRTFLGRDVAEAIRRGFKVMRQGDLYLREATEQEKAKIDSNRVEQEKAIRGYQNHIAEQIFDDGWHIYVRGKITHPQHPHINLEDWYTVVGSAHD
ncbi:MAG: hypothetical protein KIH08_14885 [Candidatus Freyarchaeota archaeon]|nr:hypothetical protein [Candidatus Jordarchaeia archaeon]